MLKITFVEKQPLNTWQQQASNDYGFCANVNPTVDRPRWSQSTERRIGEFVRRKTLMFNGYVDRVQSMYAGGSAEEPLSHLMTIIDATA